MSVSIDTTTGVTEQCVSCDTPLSGPYCSRCGEHVLEPEALTLRHFLVHTVAHELLHVDGALWRTLRVLFVRPGRLSLEYAAGRRRPYVNPFRLLLIAIVVYVLTTASGFDVTWNFGRVTLSAAPLVVSQNLSIEDTVEKVDKYGLLRQQMAAKQKELSDARARERFHDRLAAFAQPASFTNVFLLAAVLHLVFRREGRRFLEHAAFSMHVVSFVLFSSLTLFVAMRALQGRPFAYLLALIFLVSLWQFVYLAVAVRRFYVPTGRWGSRLLPLATAILLYALNSVFMTAVQVAGAAIALALF